MFEHRTGQVRLGSGSQDCAWSMEESRKRVPRQRNDSLDGLDRFADCKSLEEYVNDVMSTGHKLAEVGFKVDDTWLASLLLMGLSENYELMIMGLEV